MAENPPSPTKPFPARLAELHAAATSDDYTFAANWNLIVYLRNHTEAILALVEAAENWKATMSEHDRLVAAGEPVHQACRDHEASIVALNAALEALNRG